MDLRLLYLLHVIVILNISKIIDAKITVEIRIDKLDASMMTSRIPCCNSGQCACRSRLRVCIFERSQQNCPAVQFEESNPLGGLILNRTPSLLTIDTGVNMDSIAMRVQLVYGPTTSSQQMDVFGNFLLDLSALPKGPNRDQVGWAEFELTRRPGFSMALQVKVFCAQTYYGQKCSDRCEPVPSRYYCDDQGKRVCLGQWAGELCDTVNPCLSFPCLNDGTCHAEGKSYRCECNSLYTGPDCSLGKEHEESEAAGRH